MKTQLASRAKGRVDFTEDFGAHSQLWTLFSLGAGLRLGWLNAITADLSVAQVAQGQGLLGTGTVPDLLQTGPRKNARFVLILTSRL
jgi:hypothetical protein